MKATLSKGHMTSWLEFGKQQSMDSESRILLFDEIWTPNTERLRVHAIWDGGNGSTFSTTACIDSQSP